MELGQSGTHPLDISEDDLTPVFSSPGSFSFNGQGDDYLQFAHTTDMAVTSGTLSLSFAADDIWGWNALFSKDGSGFEDGGHLTAWVVDGRLKIRQQTADSEKWITVPELLILEGQTYHMAVSFGDEGLKIYVNGQLVAAEPTFKVGFDMNDRALVVGASGIHRENDTQEPRDPFDGTISDIALHDGQLSPWSIADLAGGTNSAFEMQAEMALGLGALAPALAQLHHGSDTLREIADSYGFNHHGHFKVMTPITTGTVDADTMNGTVDRDAFNGGFGDDVVNGLGGDDVLQGYYGNDTLDGGAGNDVLDGGHGEDILRGGDGNDFIISQADGREPYVTYDADRDEGDPDNELTNGKLYPDQPIPADDILIGGAGADIFYFQTLINAKKRFIEKHTNDDGTIRWHGVAGENDDIHNHWVDEIGNDVIMDYSKSEGDRIIIEGHTTEIFSITYGDENGDGVNDYSLITLYSDQGNGGGAHNDDFLGTIKVFGDFVTWGDIEQDAGPAYGIVKDIDGLAEALAPLAESIDTGAIAPPAGLINYTGYGSIDGNAPVFALPGDALFDGDRDSALEFSHTDAMEVGSGTLALTFTADDIWGWNALFSKDGSGYDEGGHLTAWVVDGRLKIRQQSDSESKWITVPELLILPETTYHLAVSFGEDGLKIYVNGELMAAEPTFKVGFELNERELVIGASGSHRDNDDKDPSDPFDGTISDVRLYDAQLAPGSIAGLAGEVNAAFEMQADMAMGIANLAPAFAQHHNNSETLKAIIGDYGFTHHGHFQQMTAITTGSDGNNTLSGTANRDAMNGGFGNDDVSGLGGDDVLQGYYGNDTLEGGDGDDVIDGGHGEDILNGGAGDDLIISRSDGREPYVTFDPDRDEGDPDNELTNGKLYPDQPVPADDVLIGGAGADVFYFQTLINAKERFIEKHTNDDGSIRWHGVAGENDDIHNHWVDEIGNDVIMDYSKAEGDRIIIEGHTTYVYSITYGDENGDGVTDYSLITLYSDQGNGGGAHNDDFLGTIKVFGDRVTWADVYNDAGPAYGIVENIDGLDEALAPLVDSVDTGPIDAPDSLTFYAPGTQPVSAYLEFHLVDTDTDEVIAVLQPGDPIDGTLVAGRNVSIAAVPLEGAFGIGSVRMTFGEHTQVEHNVPYSLFGDHGSNYKNGVPIEAGFHSILVEVFAGEGAQGTPLEVYDLGITIVDPPNVEVGTSANDIMDGQMGDDSMTGQGGDDWIAGKAGHDTLSGGAGADELIGQDGDDNQYGGSGNDTLSGGAGRDLLAGNSGHDELFGGFGNDNLQGGDDNDLLAGGNGNDEMMGGQGADRLYGGSGEDTAYGGDGNDFLTGYTDNDHVFGDGGQDTVYGGTGDDTLSGGNGHDFVAGNQGMDHLSGGSGNDTLDAGIYNDVVMGDSGNDIVSGNIGNDTVDGGDGFDTVIGGDGNDLLSGGHGIDELFGGKGRDTIDGGWNSDLATGNAGDDVIIGGFGHDTLLGGDGRDEIDGGRDNDSLAGNSGNDTLTGGLGNDTLNGGYGDDLLVFEDEIGSDEVIGFRAGAGSEDILSLTGYGDGLDSFAELIAVASDDGTNTIIDLGSGNTITLIGVVVADLHEDDFIFG